jgi:hypothetical protein
MAGSRLKRLWGLFAAGIAAALLVPAAASANTITVNSNADPSASAPGCTLHDAITAANNNTVVNGCAAGGIASDTINISLPTGSTITLAGALPNLTSDMSINGPGSGQLTVTGLDLYRPFKETSLSTDSISGMTITHGLCDSGCSSSAQGGAIYNSGTLTLTDVVVSFSHSNFSSSTDNFAEGGGIENTGGATLHLILSTVIGNLVTASGGSSQNDAAGGGILSNGTLTLDRSTVSSNSASATGTATGFSTAAGGGISTRAALTLTRSTIDHNTVDASGSSAANTAQGGGISGANAPAVTISLDRTTINGNVLTASGTAPTANGGGIGTDGSTFTVTSSTISENSAAMNANLRVGSTTHSIANSIVANPLGGGANCNTINTGSLGYNIDSTATCGFTQTGDHQNTPPLLGPLADNGGPTQTMAPSCGSPALDQGSAFGATTDQRGLTRPVLLPDYPDAATGDVSDIGAVELQTTPGTACLSATSNDFGNQPVDGGPTAPITITLTNGGTTDIHITTAAVTGPDASQFPKSAETCTGTTLTPGTSCAFGVGFDPSSAGAKSAAISFTDDASLSPQQVALTGTGIAPSTPPATAPPTPPPPATLPDTSLTSQIKKKKHKATFTFSSADGSSSYLCKLDKRAFSPCTSPIIFRHLRTGKHTFTVEAVNVAGADPSPATFRFKLKP